MTKGPLANGRERRPIKTHVPPSTRAIAGGVAVTLHLVLGLLIYSSLSSNDLALRAPPEGGAMFASLTPASALEPRAEADPATADLEALNSSLAINQAPAPSRTQASSDGGLLQQMDALQLPSSNTVAAKQAHAPVPHGVQAPGGPSLQEASNPWAHASVVAADPSFVRALWADIRPCWHGDAAQGQAILQVALDGAGNILTMTLMQGQREDPPVQAAAYAIKACAPYRIGVAGTFLVRAPA